MQQKDNTQRKNRRKKRRKKRNNASAFGSLKENATGVLGLILMTPRSLITKVALVVILIAFIVSVYSTRNANDVPLSGINDQLCAQTKIEKMEKCNARQLLQNIGINASAYDSFLYYKSKNNMNADEVLILKAKNTGSLDDAVDAVEEYADSRAKTFGQYAPKEAAKQKNAIIQQRGKYLFYCAAAKPEKYEEVFSHAV